MSDWITDRLPNAFDGHHVWVTHPEDGTVSWIPSIAVSHGMPWKHMAKPDPYVPPKPAKRRLLRPLFEDVVGIESRPDDPDFDDLIEVATQILRSTSIGDQNFIELLRGPGEEAATLRLLLVRLAEVLRGEVEDD